MRAMTYGEVLARFGQALSDPIRARLLALREAPGCPATIAYNVVEAVVAITPAPARRPRR